MWLTRGIAVTSWVNLDSSCEITPKVFGDELQVEFGSRAASLGLHITEDMVDKLLTVFTDAKTRFRELDEETDNEPQNVG
ncbi:hypothetical protein ACFWY9_18395 [Amycolatopsis sp. NPDC059027]|uniref:hypothetical protein n=1 Tax=unclassified Amycolatopsis TaxID=2618356 RepID=UPI003670D313